MKAPKLYFRDTTKKLRAIEVDVTEEAPDLMENLLEHCGPARDATELSDQLQIGIIGAVVGIIDCKSISQ